MVRTADASKTRILGRAGEALLLVIALASLAPAARADLYGASSEYQKGDYAHALTDFLALAKLGQPVTQFNVAVMYRRGQGTPQSDIHAYAWAMLAAENGEPHAKKLADAIRPQLAPGSEQIAGWITAPYTPATLAQRLLPVRVADPQSVADTRTWHKECSPVKLYKWVYPEDARLKGEEGSVFVAFTLMPDGTARIPRIIAGVLPDVFGPATRSSVLRDGFAPLPAGSSPIHCVAFYRYLIGHGYTKDDYPGLNQYVDEMRQHANAGDPKSQLFYGMLLIGLPQLNSNSNAGLSWFVRAAQAGLPLGQFQVGYSLLMAIGCQRDEKKALIWLRMAADQNEPNAEVTLALNAMRGSSEFGDIAQARDWLEKAAAQGNRDGELYLSALLAGTPDSRLRDPQRAMELLKKIPYNLSEDPTAFEIRAAAQAAEGDFADAAKTERKAIRRAHSLDWDPSPLQARLADYQADRPWYGDLLDF